MAALFVSDIYKYPQHETPSFFGQESVLKNCQNVRNGADHSKYKTNGLGARSFISE